VRAHQHASCTEKSVLTEPRYHREVFALHGRTTQNQGGLGQRSKSIFGRRTLRLAYQGLHIRCVRANVNLANGLIDIPKRVVPVFRALNRFGSEATAQVRHITRKLDA